MSDLQGHRPRCHEKERRRLRHGEGDNDDHHHDPQHRGQGRAPNTWASSRPRASWVSTSSGVTAGIAASSVVARSPMRTRLASGVSDSLVELEQQAASWAPMR